MTAPIPPPFSAFADAAATRHEGASEASVAAIDHAAYRRRVQATTWLAEPLAELLRGQRDPGGGRLANGVDLLVESTRSAWMANRDREVDPRALAEVVHVPADRLDAEIDALGRSARFVRQAALRLHAITRQPVVLVFNARGGTPYSFAFDDVPDVEDIDWTRRDAAPQTPLLMCRNFKISSHEYVRTRAQAEKLSGLAPWRDKVRPHFIDRPDGATEEIPDVMAHVFEEGLPLVFVDIPTWGQWCSSSCGLDRKPKDLDKWRAGVRRPYKMLSYAEHARYAVLAFSVAKYVSGEDVGFFLRAEAELDLPRDGRACVFLNPRAEPGAPLWDNCPQVLGDLGHRYSPLRRGDGFEMLDGGRLRTVPRDADVIDQGHSVPLSTYVRRRVAEIAREDMRWLA